MELNYYLHFSIHNLPFGVFKTSEKRPTVGVAYKNQVIDLAKLAGMGLFGECDIRVFENQYLNDFIALGKEFTTKVRNILQEALSKHDSTPAASVRQCMIPMELCQMQMPVKIGDYTDFYSSEIHARNVGAMFRDPQNPLLPNWKHLPVAYHGRASSIRLSGENFYRPKGQRKINNDLVFGPTLKLDFELEMAAIIGKSTTLGKAIDVNKASEYVFGYVMFNDWSARDIQAWEYVPLGPFLGKNFFSSISPWVVSSEALEPFKVKSQTQSPKVLEYLASDDLYQYDVPLRVSLKTQNGQYYTISESNYKSMYWTVNQQIAHHTVGGCPLNIGDLMASGTISSETGFGSMLELSHPEALKWPDGTERKFIEDGDSVIFEGLAQKDGISVGFGFLENKVLASL